MRFLVCSLAAHGFLYPAIAVATALRRRGHEVAFVTDTGAADTLAAADLRRLPRGLRDGPSFQVQHWGVDLSIAIQVKHVEHALDLWPADVLVGQPLTLGPLIVAERRRLPIGIIGLAPYLWPVADDRTASVERAARRAWRYADALETYNAARRLFKLDGIDPAPEQSPFLGDLYVLQSVPELSGDPTSLPSRVHLVGACLWAPPARPDAELEARLAAARQEAVPLLYVQQGRSFDAPRFWPRLVEAIGHLDLRVVADVGRMDGVVGAVPETFLVRRHVDQGPVLLAASATVSGGNTAAVLGALVHGLPSVLLPAGGEQEDLAEECVTAGAALALPPDAEPTAIRRCVERVIADPALTQAAGAVGSALRRAGGRDAAASLLERLVVTGRPVERAGV